MIELEQAGFAYGTHEIFAGVSVELGSGSFHFLTGPSGAGKTTFLRMAYLDLLPTTGHLRVMGEDVSRTSRDGIADLRRRIGVVHQDCRFLDHMSIRENVALPLTVAGQEVQGRQDEITDLLAWVGLSERAEARPPELSGGERQRAAMARAVMLSPDVILADEPTGNVDWEMGQKVMTLLIELNRLGKTVLVATHDLSLIRWVGSQVPCRVLRLKGGRLEIAGAEV